MVLSLFIQLLISWHIILLAVTSQLRGKWQEKQRLSASKDINVVRWEQLKQLLQSGKHKVCIIFPEPLCFEFLENCSKCTVNVYCNIVLCA